MSILKNSKEFIQHQFSLGVYNRAVKAYEAGSHYIAEEYLIECTKSVVYNNKYKANCASMLANSYFEGKLKHKDYVKAEIYMRLSLNLHEDTASLQNLGGFFVSQAKFDDAIPLLNRCLNFKVGAEYLIDYKAACAHYMGVIYSIKNTKFYDPSTSLSFHQLAVILDSSKGYDNALKIAVKKFEEDDYKFKTKVNVAANAEGHFEQELAGFNEDGEILSYEYCL